MHVPIFDADNSLHEREGALTRFLPATTRRPCTSSSMVENGSDWLELLLKAWPARTRRCLERSPTILFGSDYPHPEGLANPRRDGSGTALAPHGNAVSVSGETGPEDPDSAHYLNGLR